MIGRFTINTVYDTLSYTTTYTHIHTNVITHTNTHIEHIHTFIYAYILTYIHTDAHKRTQIHTCSYAVFPHKHTHKTLTYAELFRTDFVSVKSSISK